MKAMILAAGKGSRLGAITEGMPKPMLSLGGRPILARTIEQLAVSGFDDIVINLHHAPDVIPSYFGDGKSFGVRITYSVEAEILGTAGAVKRVQSLLNDAPFLVVYGDNILDWDPMPMMKEHRTCAAVATIAVAEIPDARQSGLVRFSPSGDVLQFREKPGELANPRGWVNAGVYVLEPAVLDCVPQDRYCDFGFDVFPRLLEQGRRIRAFQLRHPPLAVDTPATYELAQRQWLQRAATNHAH